MPRSVHTITAACAVILALAATSHAAPAKAKSHAVVGTLQKIEGQTLTVQTANGLEAVTLTSDSRAHRGATTIQLSALQTFTGQRVKVRYIDLNGHKQAQTVTVATVSHVADPASAPAQKGTKK